MDIAFLFVFGVFGVFYTISAHKHYRDYLEREESWVYWSRMSQLNNN